MKRTNGQGGITLIALVVTIVVLLILAGITITYVLADDGLFQQAQDAKVEQEAAAIRDYLSVATADAMITWYSDEVTAATEYATPADVVELIQANFPAGYTVASTDATLTDGKIGGTFTVTVGTNVHNVNFTSGTFTVTPPTAQSGD